MFAATHYYRRQPVKAYGETREIAATKLAKTFPKAKDFQTSIAAVTPSGELRDTGSDIRWTKPTK
jgi:hypothetical protein